MGERLQTALMVVTLLACGFLLGSAWFAWKPAGSSGGSGTYGRRGASPASASDWEARLRVEVLNGMGEEGAAERAAFRLREMGFDVVYFGNAESFDVERTSLIARSAPAEVVRPLADSLGLAEISPEPAPELYLDATVIIGADWEEVLAARDTARVPSLLQRLWGRFSS